MHMCLFESSCFLSDYFPTFSFFVHACSLSLHGVHFFCLLSRYVWLLLDMGLLLLSPWYTVYQALYVVRYIGTLSMFSLNHTACKVDSIAGVLGSTDEAVTNDLQNQSLAGERGSTVWVGLVRYKMDADSKTLQRVPGSHERTGDADTTAPTGSMRSPALLTPRSSIIGGTPYLRVGNGNQLVRDPKAASRALASEKVRWSLHNARSRGAKRQQYCQFFTKFGKCNKDNGKCSYIHDPDKVAVCTKFLKGTCVAMQCLLTHKVIPERMPDCLFFLEGLCTHENCSYRHVNVNPKAPYCDGFLRGYCKDGDKCNKKHTYVCPVYAETGDCLVQTTCKFHHPKKKVSLVPVQSQEIGTKRKRRYFSEIQPNSSKQKVSVFVGRREDLTEIDNGDPGQGSLDQDFISLSNFESDDDQNIDIETQTWAPPGLSFQMKDTESGEDLEKWLKPPFLLQPTPAPTVAH